MDQCQQVDSLLCWSVGELLLQKRGEYMKPPNILVFFGRESMVGHTPEYGERDHIEIDEL